MESPIGNSTLESFRKYIAKPPWERLLRRLAESAAVMRFL
jgi:hypothetical protein